MKGRTIAVPSRFSDERLIVFRVLKKYGMKPSDLKIVEMAPPDVTGALAAGAIDAFSMGEPFPSQAEIGGYGRVLFHAREHWPDYMSCVLVVREDVIASRPSAVQTLVDGVARSGLWLEEGKPHRDHAADFVGRFYYNQNPKILRWALTNPLDRVMYTPLSPRKADFDLVRDLMIETGVLDRKIEFEEYVDTRFAEGAKEQDGLAVRGRSAARRAERAPPGLLRGRLLAAVRQRRRSRPRGRASRSPCPTSRRTRPSASRP